MKEFESNRSNPNVTLTSSAFKKRIHSTTNQLTIFSWFNGFFLCVWNFLNYIFNRTLTYWVSVLFFFTVLWFIFLFFCGRHILDTILSWYSGFFFAFAIFHRFFFGFNNFWDITFLNLLLDDWSFSVRSKKIWLK